MTATVNAAIAAISKHIGFPAARGRTIARQLTNANLLPFGAPGKAPAIKPKHFVRLLIGLAADSGMRTAAATVEAYDELTIGGLPSVDGVPMHLRATATDVLEVHAETAIRGDIEVSSIEFVTTWPELAITDADGTHRYREVGAIASHWATNHRTSTTILGRHFVDAARALFSEKK